MGKQKDKKKKNRDPEKKAAQQAKKEAKADKKAQKRLQKQQTQQQNEQQDENVDEILESFRRQTLELTTTVVEELDQEEFPFPPRGNFTLTSTTNGDMYLFGGEYFNGVDNLVFDELFQYNPTKNAWKRILTPEPRPAARCSHSVVFYNQALYIFGGEMATADQYHHYRDFWKYDIPSKSWTELVPITKSTPPPRSGHRSVVWRHYMLLFGGFYEGNLREVTRWYNDLWIYDFSTNSWHAQLYSKLATLPAPRSAFNFTVCPTTDVAYVYGGFSKIKNPAPGTKAEGKTYTDGWALHLANFLSSKVPTWERLSRKGEYPSPRSGTACTIYKNSKMIVFGGVQDDEGDNHRMKSVFYDDLFTFDMDRKRWYSLRLNEQTKKKKKTSRRRKQTKKDAPNNEDEEEDHLHANQSKQHDTEDEDISEADEGLEGEATSNGWNLEKLRSNMFAFIDGDGNIVYEKIDENHNDDDDDEIKLNAHSKVNNTSNTYDDEYDEEEGYQADVGEPNHNNKDTTKQANEKDSKHSNSAVVDTGGRMMSAKQPTNKGTFVGESEVMKVDENGTPQAVMRDGPLPRINAEIVISGTSTLYLYGGLLEVGDREITLDDCWCLDLHQRTEWKCIFPGTMHKQVWKGIDSDVDTES